jgi:DNA repair exonuclease SbcCD nuclease subunit
MENILAKILVYGDLHLSSKNYGAHRDYPKESLYCLSMLKDTIKEENITHVIGCGDFSFGRFNSIEYREAVDNNLSEILEATNGNHWELKGNHDSATYGKTERDYYVSRGLIKESENIIIGNVNISMIDYGLEKKADVLIKDTEDMVNIIVAHNFVKCSDNRVANFGDALILDQFEKWFGADYIICGHVHKDMEFDGGICKDGMGHKVHINYPGCMTRPAYKQGQMDDKAKFVVITVYDNNRVSIDNIYKELWALEESFCIENIEDIGKKKEEANKRVDIRDILDKLDESERGIGGIEEIINGYTDIDEKYRKKAIELLSRAQE